MNAITKTNSKDKIRLCIIEENKLMRSVFQFSLNEHKDILIEEFFDNPSDCVDFFEAKMKTEKIDIILLELRQRKINSFDFIEKIKSLSPELKIIIITDFEDEKIILKAMSYGINAYVSKDIDFEELYDIVYCIHKGAMWIDKKVAKIIIKAFKEQSLKNSNSLLINKLTEREKEVLKFISDGLSNTQISQKLSISSHTVKAHVSNIISKLSVTDRVQAAVKACRCELFN